MNKINKEDIKSLMDFWKKEAEEGFAFEETKRYARGNINSLSLIYQVLDSEDDISLRDAVKLMGPVGVNFDEVG